MGAQTETELKEKKLRVEDALNATKAAVEEGIVTGGGCTLLRLAGLVDAFKESLSNEEQKVPFFFVCSKEQRVRPGRRRPPSSSACCATRWACAWACAWQHHFLAAGPWQNAFTMVALGG